MLSTNIATRYKAVMASNDDELQRKAREHGLEFINLDDTVISPSVVELLPESVARENAVLPLDEEDGILRVVMSDPQDYDTREKLVFILNRRIEIALAPRSKILEAIERYYG
jgi:type IV pilus assembly protein PilB